MNKPQVFDVTAANFEVDVLQKSAEVPVLLDFWADWCGPCKTLGPVLEKLAEEYGGGFLLGKVNADTEQELAYAFQVQSIPMCVLVANGRPVDAFAGAVPEKDVRAFLQKGGVEARAEAAEEVEVDPDSPAARLIAGLAAVVGGELDVARERLGGIGEEEPEHAAATRVLDGMAIFDAILDPDGSPAVEGIARGRELMQAGDLERAVEALMDSIMVDKNFAGELAKRAAVLCLDLMALEPGSDDDIAALRRRLATLMY